MVLDDNDQSKVKLNMQVKKAIWKSLFIYHEF